MRQLLVALVTMGAGAVAVHAVRHGSTPSSASALVSSVPIKAQPHRPTVFGVNLAQLAYWTHERAFMNLVAGGHWYSALNNDPARDFDRARIDGDGTILSLRAGERAGLPLVTPDAAFRNDVRIHCTFEGKGDVFALSGVDPTQSPHTLDFTWKKGQQVGFYITRTDEGDPIRHIDCREAGADRTALFDPVFLESLRPYRVVRVQGWQSAVENSGTGDWSRRTLPSNVVQSGEEGAAVEHIVALANAVGFDPWFTMPWKADDAYEEKFARYVHDHLDPRRTIYIEVGNEVWNMALPPGPYVQAEAKARNLDQNADVARMKRYAQRSTEVFAIWRRVFGSDGARVVRVLSGQSVWPDLLRSALDYNDTAKHVDAIAIAPYFGMDLLFKAGRNMADMDAMFQDLSTAVDARAADIRKNKAVADSYGLRLLCYEAGQHVLGYGVADTTLVARLNRDPRMADMYRRYLAAWDHDAGDVMNLFVDVLGFDATSAWGLSEYPGQPMSETPKRRAVLEAIAAQPAR